MHKKFLLLAMVCLFIVATPARAHDEVSNEELARVYQGLLKSVANLQTTMGPDLSAPFTPAAEGAMFAAVLEFVKAYELNVKSDCPQCTVEDFKKIYAAKFNLVQALGGWVKAVGKAAWAVGQIPVMEVPERFYQFTRRKSKQAAGGAVEVYEQRGLTYTLVWGISTIVFEVLEHGLQFHAGCAAFQTIYHPTASLLLTGVRLGAHPWGDASPFVRFVKAYPTSIRELKLWFALNYLFRKIPLEVVEDEEQVQLFRGMLATAVENIRKITKDAAFSEDAFAYFKENDPQRAEMVYLPPTVEQDFEILMSDAPTTTKTWVAFQHTQGLRSLHQLLGKAVIGQMGDLTPHLYFALKRTVGSLGSLIDEYSTTILALANSSGARASETNKKVLRWSLGEILKLFAREELNAMLEARADDVDLPALRQAIREVKAKHRSLVRSQCAVRMGVK